MQIALLLLVAVFAAPAACAEGVVSLVRHAKRSLEVAGDEAPLPKAGVDRARTVARMPADAGLAELITTHVLRSRQTGAPGSGQVKLKAEVDHDHMFVVQMYPSRPPSMVRLRFEVADRE